MTSHKLFSHFEPLGAILDEIKGLFNRIISFDIKHAIWQPFCFLNYVKITIRLAFEPYIFCENLMKLAGIFRDLEQLYDFQTIGYGSHFVFQKEAKIVQRQVFIPINIPCKFGEDIFINE